ncbi:hypothetical protein [Rhizobium sp. rho-13.1]|uniref:LexA family protein n=1 Tax=Rhizobium sp. rho-13.1 TaxID=2506431 RepID=UPI001386BD28|nr:hypothetical protein [Rhizobium sp. rho-13.1]
MTVHPTQVRTPRNDMAGLAKLMDNIERGGPVGEIPVDIKKAAYSLGAAIRYHIATSKLDLVKHDAVIDELIVEALMKARTRRVATVAITSRQRDLLELIRSYAAENEGLSPSYAEMRDRLGVKSRATIHRLVTGLEERGAIRRLSGHARSVVIVGEAA